jgi:hypothetical protein
MSPRNKAICVLVVVALPQLALAQELEPGAYWPIPRGTNIVTVLESVSWGDVAFDVSLPVDEARATIVTTAVAFTRGFSLGGRSANVSVVLPVVGGHLEGLYLGAPAEADRFGLGDPRVKIAMNLFGAPSMTPKQFGAYRLGSLVGISLTVAPPLGEYDSSKFVNLGSNRWSLKPELGWSRAWGKWIVEAMAGVWVFTDNTSFQGGRTREQDPIVALQVHLTHRFTPTMWLAGDANFYTGGQTTIGGRENVDFQKNSRIGATFSRVLARGHALRASVSRGAITRIGADFTTIAVGYNYAWVKQPQR